MRYKDQKLEGLRFNEPSNPSWGVKPGKGSGRIVLSALVFDNARLLGFGIDVLLPKKETTKQCAFTIAIFSKTDMSITRFYSYKMSDCK